MSLIAPTQLAVDSVGYVDQQVAAMQALTVPSVQVGNLQTDLKQIKQEAAVWPNSLRSEVIAAMQQVIACATQFIQSLPSTANMDQKALVAFMTQTQQSLGGLSHTVDLTGTHAGDFRSQLDHDVSSLNQDLLVIQSQISTDQQKVRDLHAQVRHLQEKLARYQRNPFERMGAYIIDLLTGNIRDLTFSSWTVEQEEGQLNNTQQSLWQLLATTGPLTSLTTAATKLSSGLIYLKGAVDEVSNTLQGLLQTPPIAAIIQAELQTIGDDLKEASRIANEVINQPATLGARA